MLLADWKILKGASDEADNKSEEEKLKEAVGLKYHYAGGSARYMFDAGINLLEKSLNAQCKKVPRWSAFTATNLAESTDDAVNSLMQQFYSNEAKSSICAPVSRYVLLRAYEECRSKLTFAISIAAKATKNGALEGWAFELSQKDIIYSALKSNRDLVTAAVNSSKVTFTPKNKTSYERKEVAGEVVNGSVIWCSNPNQALFDVAFYFDKTLVTLQFTISKKHKLNLEYLPTLRVAIEKKAEFNRVVHLGIVKNEIARVFKFSSPTGTARDYETNVFTVEVDHSEELEKIELVVANTVQPNGTTYRVKKL